MSFVIIIKEKEKLYHVESCCDASYWEKKNDLIQDVLGIYSFKVLVIDHLLVDAEKEKDTKVAYLESQGYKKAFLSSEMTILAGKVNDELRQKGGRKRR